MVVSGRPKGERGSYAQFIEGGIAKGVAALPLNQVYKVLGLAPRRRDVAGCGRLLEDVHVLARDPGQMAYT